MSAAAPSYCVRKDIHAGCKRQRSCSRNGCVRPCAGWQRSKTGTNPAKAVAIAERKRGLALAAAASNPSLRLLAAACLRRPDVSQLFARGSRPYVYVYQWTAEDDAGWSATRERKESLSHVFSANPPLWVREPSGLRKITPDDIFYAGSGAYIIRLAISPLLCDNTEIEKIIRVILSNGDVVGFIGHVKNGGSPATQRRYVYGARMLVILDLAALCLVVNEKYREVYERELAQFGGREGRVVLPAAPPAAFALPPPPPSPSPEQGREKLRRWK